MKQRILKAVTVRFEEPIRSELEEIAQRQHRTMSDQIRHYVEAALAADRQPSEAA